MKKYTEEVEISLESLEDIRSINRENNNSIGKVSRPMEIS